MNINKLAHEIHLRMEESTTADAVRLNVNRLAEINNQMAELKEEKDRLEATFIALAENDLRDTKRKTARYMGDGVRVSATMAASVKLVYPSLAKKFPAYPDLVKEETKYSLTTAGTRLLGGICKRDYIRYTVDEALGQIADKEHLPVLLKKVRGKNFETDKRGFMAVLGCGEAEAERNAYFVAEAAVWQEFDRLTQELSWDEREELIGKIDAAVSVTEQPKIQVEILED